MSHRHDEEPSIPMGLRLTISRLASSGTRAAAARALALLAVFGFLLTMIIVIASGGAPDRWFFVLLVWALFVYVPLRILLEAAQTFAPVLRRTLAAQAAGRAGRYATRSGLELMVDSLFEREVVMPRVATPVHAEKAKAGAVAVLARAGGEAGLHSAASVCLGAVDRWVTWVGEWAARDAGQNIQARWGEVRALAAMAAMTRVLLAAYEDRAAAAFGEPDGPLADPAEFLDACLDYCDTLALEVEITPWPEPALNLPHPPGGADEVRQAWKTFVETGPPALHVRSVFVEALLTASSPPARSSAS